MLQRADRGIRRTLIVSIFALGAALAFACASTPETKTAGEGAGQPAMSAEECAASHEECKTRCRAEPDSGSRGPCFNGCLKSFQACGGSVE